MKSLTGLAKAYLVIGTAVGIWFIMVAANGWKAPNLGVAEAMAAAGRSSGGSWGGGK